MKKLATRPLVHLTVVTCKKETLTAEQKAIEIVDAFMDTSFDELADAAAWLVKHIKAALEQFEARRTGSCAARTAAESMICLAGETTG
jgi:hypothetical protein